MSADRNLLFGILALQNDFITRDQLVEAMNAWVLAKQRPLGDVLRERGVLGEEEHALLDALVNRQIARHGDAEKSLQALSSVSSARSALAKVQDQDVQASLAHVSVARNEKGPDSERLPSTTDYLPTDAQRYRILRPHARGGLGEVFVAEDQELHREVALKEIQKERAHESHSRGRFLLEAEITGGLEHPGIVPVYGLGQYADGRPFYAMRFIRGDNLKEAVKRFHETGGVPDYTSVAFRRLLGRFIDVCNAVAYAHSRGVLHRDLKPGNIMLGKYGETLVVDWGLAKVLGARSVSEGAGQTDEPTLRPSSGSGLDATEMGSAIGTPAYMSPEQAEGRLDQLGPASDVYGLGATLYTLLTNEPPVKGADTPEVLARVRRGDIKWPCRTGFKLVPPALNAICRKAMALRPADRYAAPLDLSSDLEHWLADEPVSVHPEPMLVRAGRWTRKHRTLVTSAAAVLLVAAIASILGFNVVAGKNRELTKANTQLRDLGALQISSFDWLHVCSLPLDFKTDPHTYGWRLYVPRSGAYQLGIAVSGLPQSGLPPGGGWPFAKFPLHPTPDGKESVIGVALFKRANEDWQLTVSTKEGKGKNGVTLPVRPLHAAPLSESGCWDRMVQTPIKGTMAMKPGDDPLILVDWRRYRLTAEGKVPKPGEQEATGAGLLVWIERASDKEPQ